MTKFVPRLVKPEPGNKYYIRRASGGYSTAIQGKPTDPDCDVLANCVGYAVGRFHEIAKRPQFDLIDAVNAENIFQNAISHGLETGDTPRLGAVMVWQKGATLSGSDGAGHVAVVEQIRSDTDIVTSESGYGAAKPFWTQSRRAPFPNGDGFTFLGFIYQPAAQNPYTEPQRYLRRGSFGDDVKWLQYELFQYDYMRESEIDGAFGNITFGAVLAYQYDRGLEVDGVCGIITRNSMINGR